LDVKPNYRIYKNAYFCPTNLCLYDSNGEIIEESTFIRGPNNYRPKNESKNIKFNNYQVVNEPSVYCGNISPKWGRFLTEGISRLWFLYEQPNLKSFFCNNNRANNVRELLKFSSIRNLFYLNSPTLFKKVWLPYASFQNYYKAFKIHKVAPEEIAYNLGPYKSNGRMLYYARTELPKERRQINGELEIIDFLKAKGIDICYPEKLSMKEQVRLVNEYNYIIGFLGGALHSILFRVNHDPFEVITLTHSSASPNYYFIDELKNIKNTYIYKTIKRDVSSKKKKSRQNMIADVKYIKKQLNDRLR